MNITQEILSDIVVYNKYAKYLPTEQRRETWDELVTRNKEMHQGKFPQLKEEIEDVYKMVYDKKVLPSMRSLQFAGKPIDINNSRIFNCSYLPIDDWRSFSEVMFLLLSGCGVGYSVQKHHIEKLPEIRIPKKTRRFLVGDSIEGWADSVKVLLKSYFGITAARPIFDFRDIRPKGAELITVGGKAPGPEPLRRALDKIEHILQTVVLSGRERLEPIEVYDIAMHASDAVLAGGVRRSATIALFSKDDQAMLTAKTGNWFVDNPQRGRSNNSAVIVRDECTREEFSECMKSIKEFGEPGFYFVESKEHTTNPCVEIGMFPQIDCKSGWQGCNLTEINGGKCTNKEEFFKACRAGAILGTLQAGYTDFKYLGETSKKIFEREALLGVSVTGWMNNPDILLDADIQREGAEIVKRVNKEVAELIGINAAARTTCVKPSGNASVLLETASGIHAEHAPRYLRHIQLNKDTEVAQLIAQTNPYMVEESVWSANGTDYCVGFPVISPEGSLYREDLYATNLLEKVKLVQQNWVEAGTNEELCADKTVRHNVSNTVTVMPHQWNQVEDYVFENRHSFSGISFLAGSGDKDYAQAPMTEVLTEDQIVKKYGKASLFAAGLIVDTRQSGFRDLWDATMTATMDESFRGEISDLRAEWLRRFNKFADNYFMNDLHETANCLKDVFLLHKWTKIQQNITPVDFTSQLSEKKFTDIDTMGAIACQGGACEITF